MSLKLSKDPRIEKYFIHIYSLKIRKEVLKKLDLF